MRLVIVTGMSGAGKATALKILEDAGYFCVDNLPVLFVDKFAELTASGNSEITKVAIGLDIRSGKALGQMEQILERMVVQGIPYEILFLDANNDILVNQADASAGGVRADRAGNYPGAGQAGIFEKACRLYH